MKHPMQCVFCKELSGSRDTNFARRYPEISSRIVGESASLVAFPCIGQLNPGHFLVVPKHHDAVFRDAQQRVHDLHAQLSSVVRHVHALLEASADDSLYFEHGALSDVNGGCGIYHAHIHVVPNAGHVNIKKHFPRAGECKHSTIANALEAVALGRPYVLFGSSTYGFYSQSLNGALPSQTLRRIVAEQLDRETWDWRIAGRETEFTRMLHIAGCV